MMNAAIGLNVFAVLVNLALFVAFGNPVNLVCALVSTGVALLLQRSK